MSPTALGTARAAHTLGSGRNDLGDHPADTPLGQLASLIGEMADRVDSLQEQLVAKATYAAEQLERVATGADRIRPGSTDGILQYQGVQTDMLAARRSDAIQHLKALLASYQHLTDDRSETPAPARTPAPVPAPTRQGHGPSGGSPRSR
ncbi:hypothetical protein [Streptomyces pinistramenti]|uniref:hypothetical protein n=1 Tax=Streptomyces pinistramenti TaxID=2884812 RepID=UPI001D06E89C|nr:hypothetical protein [Streptomyces pinistramenti]MCB5905880.1 hypothetical protein [Streptomyces pinistramenti]